MLSRDPETRNFIKTMPNAGIYLYMTEELEDVTEVTGEYEYTDERYKSVLKKASDIFNLSQDELDKIYIQGENDIIKFYKQRDERDKI